MSNSIKRRATLKAMGAIVGGFSATNPASGKLTRDTRLVEVGLLGEILDAEETDHHFSTVTIDDLNPYVVVGQTMYVEPHQVDAAVETAHNQGLLVVSRSSESFPFAKPSTPAVKASQSGWLPTGVTTNLSPISGVLMDEAVPTPSVEVVERNDEGVDAVTGRTTVAVPDSQRRTIAFGSHDVSLRTRQIRDRDGTKELLRSSVEASVRIGVVVQNRGPVSIAELS